MEIQLSTKQKKWFKKHKYKLGAVEIADHLEISVSEARDLLGIKEEMFVPQSYEVQILGVVLVMAFLVLSTSLGNAFVSDDIPAILNNPQLGTWSLATHAILGFWANMVHFLIANTFGVMPWAFRLANIVFHLVTSTLLFLIVRRSNPFRTAMMACLFFIVAPPILESVVWISGMPYALGGMLAMGSLYLHLDDKRTPLKNFTEIGLWTMTLMSNEKYVFLPLLLLWWDWYRGKLVTKRWLLIAWFGLALVRGLEMLSVLGERIEVLKIENYTTIGSWDNPISKFLITIGYYIWLYLWPAGLTLYHSELDLSLPNLLKYGSLTVIVGWCLMMVSKRNRDVWFWMVFSISSLLLLLLPIRVGSLVAERYAYLMFAGLAVILAICLDSLFSNKRWNKTLYVFVGVVVLAMSLRSLDRIRDWRTADTLWFSAEFISPSSSQNHNNLGDAYANQGNLVKSIEEFTKAIELNPLYADAVHNRANSYLKLGDVEKAKQGFTEALRLNPKLWQSKAMLTEIEASGK